jgi:vacuolar-type H+-ATPase subunit E/Vma4
MKTLGSPAAVAAAIRDEADAEAERIAREGRAAVARLGEEHAGEVVALPEQVALLTAARRDAHARLAQEDLLDARGALEIREVWLQRAVTEGVRLLDEPTLTLDERRAELARLAREGLDRLPGAALEVVVGTADAPLLSAAWAQEIAPGRTVSLVVSDDIARGGCVVRTADGKVAFDNTRQARARRFGAAIRTTLGAIYKRAGAS